MLDEHKLSAYKAFIIKSLQFFDIDENKNEYYSKILNLLEDKTLKD
jgi:hypothetical protein